MSGFSGEYHPSKALFFFLGILLLLLTDFIAKKLIFSCFFQLQLCKMTAYYLIAEKLLFSAGEKRKDLCVVRYAVFKMIR